MSIAKHVPRVATRIRSLVVQLQIAEGDIPEVRAVEAVEAVEFVATEFDEEGEVTAEGVSAVEAVAAVPAVPAHINTSYNYYLKYDILDQDGEILARKTVEFSQHLAAAKLSQAKGLLELAFALVKESLL